VLSSRSTGSAPYPMAGALELVRSLLFLWQDPIAMHHRTDSDTSTTPGVSAATVPWPF